MLQAWRGCLNPNVKQLSHCHGVHCGWHHKPWPESPLGGYVQGDQGCVHANGFVRARAMDASMSQLQDLACLAHDGVIQESTHQLSWCCEELFSWSEEWPGNALEAGELWDLVGEKKWGHQWEIPHALPCLGNGSWEEGKWWVQACKRPGRVRKVFGIK